jgi:hypothetical protein
MKSRSEGFSTIEAALLLAIMLPIVTGLVTWLEVLRTQNRVRFAAYSVLRQLEVESRRGEVASLRDVLSRLENAVFEVGKSRFVEISLYLGSSRYMVDREGVPNVLDTKLLGCMQPMCVVDPSGLKGLSALLKEYIDTREVAQVYRTVDPKSGGMSVTESESSVIAMSLEGKLKGLFVGSDPISFSYSSVVEVG